MGSAGKALPVFLVATGRTQSQPSPIRPSFTCRPKRSPVQFHSPVLCSTLFRLIRCDRSIHAASEGIQSICADPVFTAEYRHHCFCAPMTHLEAEWSRDYAGAR